MVITGWSTHCSYSVYMHLTANSITDLSPVVLTCDGLEKFTENRSTIK